MIFDLLTSSLDINDVICYMDVTELIIIDGRHKYHT